MGETVRRILDTWPDGVRPKIHFSSPRTELRELKRKDKATKKTKTVHVAPIWTGHADYVHPFEFMGFMRSITDRDFDVMIEAKAKDLALIRLRPDMLRYAPDVAARFGLSEAERDRLDAEEEAVIEGQHRRAGAGRGRRAGRRGGVTGAAAAGPASSGGCRDPGVIPAVGKADAFLTGHAAREAARVRARQRSRLQTARVTILARPASPRPARRAGP